MEKDRIISIILIILSIFVFALLIIFSTKYTDEYSYKEFMLTFESKLDKLSDLFNKEKILYAFESVFHHYTDSTGLTSFVEIIKVFFIDLSIFIGVSFLFVLQIENVCKGEDFLKFILSIY